MRIDSRSNVGNALNVSCSCSLRSAIVPKTVFELRIRPGQLAVARAERVEDDAGVADRAAATALLLVELLAAAVRVLGERREVAERGVEVRAAALDPLRERLLPDLERLARPRVERAEDLVQLDGRRHLRVGQRAVLGQQCRALVAGRQLDVGLAEQRLLAQDRARVLGIGA